MTHRGYARVSLAEQDMALQIWDLEAAGRKRIQVQELPLRRQLRRKCPVAGLMQSGMEQDLPSSQSKESG